MEDQKVALKPLKLSVSAAGSYESCPRRYWYMYLDPVKRPKVPTEAQDIGNFVHEVLQMFHDVLRNGGPINDPTQWGPILTGACTNAWTKYAGRLSEEARQKATGLIKEYIAHIKRVGVPEVLATEEKFSVDIGEGVELRGIIDRVDQLTDGRYKIVDYKGLAVDTPIPTPTGWTTMGELKVGDFVLGSDGKPTAVTLKSDVHNRPCYKLTLSDGSTVVCDNVHLWSVGYRQTGNNKNYDAVLDTDELFVRWTAAQSQQSGSFVIQNPQPLILPEVDLPIDPWLLGAWLGDGHSRGGSITVGSQDLVEMQELIRQHWGATSVFKDNTAYTVSCNKPHKGLCGYGHDLSDAPVYAGGQRQCRTCQSIRLKLRRFQFDRTPRWNVPFGTILGNVGLRHNKHVPDIYLRASLNQRLALLQGLMDTDGSWNPIRKRCVFVTTKASLAFSVIELIRTLGVTVQIFTGVDNKGNVSHRLEFKPVGFNPFLLPRKAKQVDDTFPPGHTRPTHLARRRTITNIEKTDSVPTQCIAVDAPDSLYLCGDGMILTHNTGQSKYLDSFQLRVYGMYLKKQVPELETYSAQYLVLSEGPKEKEYDFTMADVEKARLEMLEIANQIRTDKTWVAKPTRLCNWCDFKEPCPSAWGKEPELVSIGKRVPFGKKGSQE